MTTTIRKQLQTTLRELRAAGYELQVSLTASNQHLYEECERIATQMDIQYVKDADRYEQLRNEHKRVSAKIEAIEEAIKPQKSKKQKFLEACNNAPRPGCLEQRPDERIDALVTDEEGAGYDSHVYAAAPTAQPLVEPETVDVQAVEVTEDETDILAVYLLAAAWAVGALCLALVVSVIFVSKMAFTGLVAGVRAYHDLCFQLGTKWGEYEMMAVRVPAVG